MMPAASFQLFERFHIYLKMYIFFTNNKCYTYVIFIRKHKGGYYVRL